MTKTVLLGATLAAILTVSVLGYAYATGASWQGITDDAVVAKNSKTTTLKITATDDVPRQAGILAGFAWLYADGPNSAFAITTHNADVDGDGKNDVRDSLQNKDGWHAHNVVLGSSTTLSTFCVTEISDAPTSGIAFNNENVKVNVKNSALTGNLGSATAAFDIVVDGDCPITFPTESVIDGGLPLGIVVHDLNP
ncbi:hypothetical protein [Nitrosopumilus adriaticus]|uniref:Uncharacterized protein n=1 Tax=Nitrosopumilus adriaticus TaxID=1580092 RepID=A0A0D5C2N0_9ARCH|nr:hypothetical protein [Nitrosopumilus adriaticus]AJW70971.1 exported protein of unknown function [Nitrosopumilus adriaticus]